MQPSRFVRLARSMLLGLALGAWCLCPPLTRAQCAGEWRSAGTFAGPNDAVSAAASWDPDGPGGRDPLLVLGGYFSAVGNADARGVATWDGERWGALGHGIAIPTPASQIVRHGIFSFLPRGQRLLAAGSWPPEDATTPLRPRVAEWDGTAWRELGSLVAADPSATVFALAEFQGQVYAAGCVGSLQQLSYSRPFVVRWDGERWQSVGFGLTGAVLALAATDDGLYAAGQAITFGGIAPSSVAKWDGTVWTAMPTLPGSMARDLVLHQGEIHVSSYANPPLPNGNVFRLAIGAWQLVGGGARADRDMHSINGNLIALGALGSSALRVMRWDGATWQMLGGQFTYATVLAEHAGRIIAAGSFGFNANDPPLPERVAAWSGSAWVALATEPAPIGRSFAVARFRGNIIAAGDIRYTGDTPIRQIAQYDGRRWSELGGGTSNPSFGFPVVLQPDGDRLLVAGSFSQAGSLPVGGLAWWDGQHWTTDERILPNSSVSTVTFLDGQLCLGGRIVFNNDGPYQFARRTASGWEGYFRTSEFYTNLMQAYRGAVYVTTGGAFPLPFGRWFPDERRFEAVTPFFPQFRAMTVFQDRLIAGGEPGALVFNGLAASLGAFDGQTWSDIGGGLNDDNGDPATINELTTDGERLIVLGTFARATGTIPVVAWWDGIAWHRFPEQGAPQGFTQGAGFLSAFADRQGTIVSGPFIRAGGSSSPGVAYWQRCPADLANPTGPRCDSAVTIDDLLSFLDSYAAGDARADVDNGSGAGQPDAGVTVDDLLYYLDRFAQGC